MEYGITESSFRLIGSNMNLAQQYFGESVDPILIVMDGKLVWATEVVQPKLTLTRDGADKPATPGDLVVVKGSLTGEYASFIKSAKITWVVSDNGAPKQCWTEGKNVVFSAGIRNTIIDVAAKLVLTYDVNNSPVQKVVTASMRVPVGGVPVPNPDPQPNPNPNPNPQPDPGLTGLSRMVYDWAKDMTIVQPDGGSLITGAQALSRSFNGISSKIGTTGYDSIRGILTQTKVGNNDALLSEGIDPRRWDMWGTKLQDYLFAEYSARRMVTNDHFKKAWYDISVGLGSVR